MRSSNSALSTQEFDTDVAVLGAGRVGLPWAVILAEKGFDVICVDTDKERVQEINEGIVPFNERGLEERLDRAVTENRLRATLNSGAVGHATVVTVCLNCPVDETEAYLDTVTDYAVEMRAPQLLIIRTTLPVRTVDRLRTTLPERCGDDTPHLGFFPERLAEGKALTDIENIPNVIGTESEYCRQVMEALLADFDAKTIFTDPLTAMFTKLIDNSYRTAMFALANYYAIVAENLRIDIHEAISIANYGFEKTDVPRPGTVGGKCLLKDTSFLSNQYTETAVDVPNLFASLNRIHEGYERLVVKRVMDYNPERVALLGTAYKRDADNESGSPGLRISRMLQDRGVTVNLYDPNVKRREQFSPASLRSADLTIVAMNHSAYEQQWATIKESVTEPIIDVWGIGNDEPGVVQIGVGKARD